MGSQNAVFGQNAGGRNTTGNRNVFLGYRAGFNELGSDRLYIDNSDTAAPLIYGEFDNDTVTINGSLTIGGTDAINDFQAKHNQKYRLQVTDGGAYCDGNYRVNQSSREAKDNIQELKTEEALAILKNIRPVKFSYKQDPAKETNAGFIAEDVPELVATKGRKGMVSLEVVAVLTKVVQEQQLDNRQDKSTPSRRICAGWRHTCHHRHGSLCNRGCYRNIFFGYR